MRDVVIVGPIPVTRKLPGVDAGHEPPSVADGGTAAEGQDRAGPTG